MTSMDFNYYTLILYGELYTCVHAYMYMCSHVYMKLTSAYMVVHAEGLTGIELLSDYSASRTAVITFLLPNQPYPLSVNLLPMLMRM